MPSKSSMFFGVCYENDFMTWRLQMTHKCYKLNLTIEISLKIPIYCYPCFCRSSDVWSFGVLSWELLTGTTPYKDFNHANVVYGVANNVLKLPIPKTCPDGWAKLMTSKDQLDIDTLHSNLLNYMP